MKKHTKIYLDYHGYSVADIIICEMPDCLNVAVDIHHKSPKGMGGNPDKDVIENLMAVCRTCHSRLHGIGE